MMEEWWRPDRFALRRDKLARRSLILAAVRGFFAERDFIEVDTPALQVSPGLEPHLHAFATRLHDPNKGETAGRYLHTSPEFAMKKLIVAGLPRIWQLSHAFRNGERSATHHPEFSMLEWYRAGASYYDLMEECTELVRTCQEAAAAEALTWRGGVADAKQAWQRLSVSEAFQAYCGIDLLATAPDAAEPDAAELAAAAPHRDSAACRRRLGSAVLSHFSRACRTPSRDWHADDSLRLPAVDGRIVAPQRARPATCRAV